MPKPFEEEYLDVLQNLEFALIAVYRDDPAFTDADADAAYSAALRFYQAETKGRAAPVVRLSPLAQSAYEALQHMCDWRLGRTQLVDADNLPLAIPLEPKTVDEIIACLKRLRKSVEFWTKKAGRQGYVRYVDEFIV